MFALRAPLPHLPPRYTKCKISKVSRSYYTINDSNTKDLTEVGGTDLLHVLTFHQPNADDGIYSIRELNEDGLPVNHILAFITFEDAFRYKTLLEAEMGRSPYIQFASRFEIKHACEVGHFKCRVVDEGVLVTPPTRTVRVTDWEARAALLNGRWSVREKN
jgi:hypothetical protein|tara:strand:- start:2970 stop:3452 length:483 start_codon:yes stop_codon:yes gene_type:complete